MASRYKDRSVTGDFLDELSNFHIDMFYELEEYQSRKICRSLGKWCWKIYWEGRKWKKLKIDLRLKISKKVSSRRASGNQSHREDSSNLIRRLLEPVCFSCKDEAGKDYKPSSLRGILGSVERHWVVPVTAKLSSRTQRDALKEIQKQL